MCGRLISSLYAWPTDILFSVTDVNIVVAYTSLSDVSFSTSCNLISGAARTSLDTKSIVRDPSSVNYHSRTLWLPWTYLPLSISLEARRWFSPTSEVSSCSDTRSYPLLQLRILEWRGQWFCFTRACRFQCSLLIGRSAGRKLMWR